MTVFALSVRAVSIDIIDVSELLENQEFDPSYLKVLKAQVQADGTLKQSIVFDRKIRVTLEGQDRSSAEFLGWPWR